MRVFHLDYHGLQSCYLAVQLFFLINGGEVLLQKVAEIGGTRGK